METLEFYGPLPPVPSPAISNPIETLAVKTVKIPPIKTNTSTWQLRTRRSHPRAAKRREVEGVWISPTGNKTGQGASRKDIQKQVGRMFGLITWPLSELTSNHKGGMHENCIKGREFRSLWMHVTRYGSTVFIPLTGHHGKCEWTWWTAVQRNLTNVGVDILKYILQEKGGFKNIQIQQEAKSTITHFSAGSKAIYMMEDESGSIVPEATPDFYARSLSDHLSTLGRPTVWAPITLRHNLQLERWDHSSN